MGNNEVNNEDKSLEITRLEDGRNQIVFRKAALKGKVSSADLLNVIMIAARLQVEKLIEKLTRGAPLEASEVKQLKELAEIAKIDTPTQSIIPQQSVENIDKIKQTLYQALTEKLSGDRK